MRRVHSITLRLGQTSIEQTRLSRCKHGCGRRGHISGLLQDRLKTAIWLDGGYFLGPPTPGGDQAEFVMRMRKPVLMVNGRYDYTFPLETSQEPLFRMLGTPADEKSHIVLDTPHDVTQQRARLTQEVLGWLDRYIGRVNLTD